MTAEQQQPIGLRRRGERRTAELQRDLETLLHVQLVQLVQGQRVTVHRRDLDAGVREVVGGLLHHLGLPLRRERDAPEPEVPYPRDHFLEIGRHRNPRALIRFCQQLQHPRPPRDRRERHAGQHDLVHVEGLQERKRVPIRGEGRVDVGRAEAAEVQRGVDQQAARRKRAVELIVDERCVRCRTDHADAVAWKQIGHVSPCRSACWRRPGAGRCCTSRRA